MNMPTCDDYDSTSLSVEAALQQIERELSPIDGEERLAIRSALNRILAQAIYSHINVPPHDKSAMDGYAVRGADLPATGQVDLMMIDTAMAGKPCQATVQTGQCIRIFTGAVIPTGADTVIMQEHVQVKENNVITITSDHHPGQHVCLAGEDLTVGQVVLSAGKRLSPADIGLLASLGVPEVSVKRRLRVAFFSTGDELRAVGELLQAGQIYDSNRYTLYGMLTRLGVEIVDMGVVRDDPHAIEQAFLLAAKENDAVITSGGVSVGDADYITDILHRIGQINFWKVAMKPGKPLAFGRIQNAAFFGLPGNPVSAMCTFYQFVQPALRRMMGQQKTLPLRFTVTCATALKKRPGRVEFQRGILMTDEQGQLKVYSTGQQGSGVLSSMSQANCFIILPAACGQVAVGDTVTVEPFEGLV